MDKNQNIPAAPAPLISIVTPMHNEAGGAAALIAEISAAFADLRHEIIVVDDASTDDTLAILQSTKAEYPALRVLAHTSNAGQSRALRTAIGAANAPIVAMLDGDGQNNPADLPMMLERLRAGPETLAMVGGERQKRQDSAAKKFASRTANAIRKSILKDGANDTGCGLKVFRRDAFLALPYFDHMHRYLPALFRREGFDIEFVPVSHRPRLHGQSKYTNFGRLLVAIRDLIGVTWLLGRARNPGKIRELD